VTESRPPTGLRATTGDDFAEHLWDYGGFQSAEEHGAVKPTTGLVDLGFVGAALKRRKKVWYLTAALGLVAGLGLLEHLHPSYQATETLVMSNDPTVDAYTAMTTDALEAKDPAVAAIVIAQLKLNESPTALLQGYTATVVSNQVFSIAVNNPDAAEATAEANAIASAYLTYRAQQIVAQEHAAITAQNQEIKQEQQQLDTLNGQISKLSAEPSSSSQRSQLSSLRALQVKTSQTLTSLQQNIGGAQGTLQTSTSAMISNSKVLYSSAAIALHSRKKYAIEYVGGALFGGLAIGLMIVAVGAIVSNKLRRRDDVADALGAPIPISVTSSAAKKWTLLRKSGGQRELDKNRVAEHLRKILPTSSKRPVSLAIVATGNAAFVSSALVKFISSCARDGNRVVVADLAHGVLARLLGTTDTGMHTIDVDGHRVVLIIPEANDVAPIGPFQLQEQQAQGNPKERALAAAYSSADIVVSLAALDPAVGADYLRTWATNAVVVVTAGESSVEKVDAIGKMIRFADIQLLSGILLGADKSDESLGLIFQ
jgi:capsular polysaccharide biosynthesis protein